MEPETPDWSADAVLAVLPRLERLSNAISRGRLAERAAEAAGLNLDRPALGVLITVRMAGAPLRIGEIAERMQVVGPHVTRQVQALERRGLVQRVADPLDRRASLIEPTPAGTEAMDRYSGTMIAWFTDAIRDWTGQDRQDLARLLGKLADDVTAYLSRLDDR